MGGMSKDNPAVFECEASDNKFHYWRLVENDKQSSQRQARCVHCKLTLTEAQTREVYEE